MGRVTAVALLALLAAGCGRGRVERVEWPVMGTVAAVQADGKPADGAAAAKRVFAEVERLLNAHDGRSELRRLEKLPDDGILAACDPSVRGCYEAAFRLRDETGRLFNPRWRGEGTMDLGAIAKGWAADLAADAAAAAQAEGRLLVDLGGNLKAARGDWLVGIAGTDETIALKEGMACATSAEYYRGKHIRDGRTGGEATNGVWSVTIVHPHSATLADGLSTVMFLMGRAKGEAFLKARHPEARAIWKENGK